MNRKFSKLWLQEELSVIFEQLKETRSRNELQKTSHNNEVRRLQEKIQEQEKEIHSLVEQNKSLDPKRIQEAVLDEAKKDYKFRIAELDAEIDRLREQYNNLRYENAILKSKFDTRETEFSRTLDRIHLEHSVEVEQLESKFKSLEKEKCAPSDSYAIELKSAKRELLELNQKITVFLSECNDLRAQNENLTLQINALTRSNSKQTADYTNNLRTLESEKLKVMRQLEVSEKELANSQEHRKALNAELQSNKQEILCLQTRMEEIEHTSRLALANLHAEMMHLKSQQESDNEQLIDEITRLRADNRNLDESLSQERQTKFVKEQELKNDLLTARQQYWKLSTEAQQEREMLEKKIKELEIAKDSHIENLSQEIQNLHQKLHASTASNMELEKEMSAMREQNGQQGNTIPHNNKIPQENLQIQREIQELKDKFHSLATNFQRYDEPRESFNRVSNISNNLVEKEHEVLQMKLTWEQQKLQFHQRLEELESQLRECRSHSVAEKRELEFKLKQYTTQVSKLREKHDALKEKLCSQKEVIEKSVPAEVHFQVKNELADVKKRVEVYKKFISVEPGLLKQPVSLHMVPGKMLADIQNIDFRSYPEQTSYTKEVNNQQEGKEIDKSLSKKRIVLSRRRSSKSKGKYSLPKDISPVLSSSSDIDLENL